MDKILAESIANKIEEESKELEKLNCQVICRLNYGHDIGAFKDINLFINNLGIGDFY